MALEHAAAIQPQHVHSLVPQYRWRHRIIGLLLMLVCCIQIYLLIQMARAAPYLILSWPFGLLLPLLVVTALILGLIGVMHLVNAERMQLITSSQGLVIDTFGYTLATPWSNISRVGVRWGEERLFLNQPASIRGWAAGWMRLYQLDRFILLAPFGQWWGDSPLAHELGTYIPHIVETQIKR